ncbi:uncharacterized protein [Dysidea avara]|uniref:uncharacterized protein n=1 Tax=Dysidea avara TaxID=196820 RepID=UPI0033229741
MDNCYLIALVLLLITLQGSEQQGSNKLDIVLIILFLDATCTFVLMLALITCNIITKCWRYYQRHYHNNEQEEVREPIQETVRDDYDQPVGGDHYGIHMPYKRWTD